MCFVFVLMFLGLLVIMMNNVDCENIGSAV
jgi:hypothetical protein